MAAVDVSGAGRRTGLDCRSRCAVPDRRIESCVPACALLAATMSLPPPRSLPASSPPSPAACCAASTCPGRATPRTRRPTASSKPSAPSDYAQALRQRAQGAGGAARAAVAVRAHAVLRVALLLLRLQQDRHAAPRARRRVPATALEREIGAARRRCSGRGSRVSQLHLGGGTPTFLSDAELARADGACCAARSRSRRTRECSIEVDPRTVDARAPGARWPTLGFNRLSFGVQDFDPDVQQAVHRVQPFEQVRDADGAARARSASSRSTST